MKLGELAASGWECSPGLSWKQNPFASYFFLAQSARKMLSLEKLLEQGGGRSSGTDEAICSHGKGLWGPRTFLVEFSAFIFF